MSRIFCSLSLFALLLLAANLIVGLRGGDFNLAASRLSEAERALRLRRQTATDEQRSKLEADYAAAQAAFEPLRKRASLHMLLGLGAALVTLLVNSITVTYFIGTSRWCREVCETYSLGERLMDESAALKRKAFPWSVAGITAVLVIVAFGAASDPSALGPARAGPWVPAHYMAAVVGLAVIAYAFARQVVAIGANYEVIEEILAEVKQIREQRGLDRDPSDAEAELPRASQ